MKNIVLRIVAACLVFLLATSSIMFVTAAEDDKYAEAARLFEAFLEATETIHADPDRFSTLLMGYRPHLGVQFQRFERFTGGTDEDWLAKTPVERWILDATYLQQLYRIGQGEREHNSWFGSEEIFLNRNIEWHLQQLSRAGDGSEYDAFKELMLWQYRYILATGTAFNFITGVSHRDGNGHTPIISQSPTVPYATAEDYDLGLTDEEREELAEMLAEAEISPTPQQPETNRDFNWAPIVVVIILLVGVIIGVIVYKNRK